ncbi:MAG: M20/M25/M40 family metallo-hydrolase [Marinicella sp.]
MLKNTLYIAIFALISWGSYQLSYPSNTSHELIYDGVFFENVIKHVDKLTRAPRAVGDYYHDDAQRYIIKQLNESGLTVRKQNSTSYSIKNHAAAPIRNIIAHYPGTNPENQALMLLAHYDAAKYAGKGAADDASGVATILETVKTLIKSPNKPSNDIVVLITDAEEIGLLGAHAFINEQLQNFDIGLIINLEARGSSGPNMMWPETVGGNRAMIEAFSAADIPMPVTTSLHYEIYKLLPNDTDLTPFNQISKINGFNFAFIDDHFNYHTKLDSIERLSINTLAHQTIQMHQMLQYFAFADLNQMYSSDSLVYFSIPMLGLISYPTALTWLLLGAFSLLFIVLISKHLRRGKTTTAELFFSAVPLIVASVLAYLWCWLLLTAIYHFFPEFKDILQGFPYQGHQIMTGLLIGTAIIAMSVFGFSKSNNQENKSIIHIFLWLLILYPMVYFLPGSGLLIWPVLFSISVLAIGLYWPKMAEQLAPIFASFSFLIVGTLLINLPIALGIKATALTAIVLVWLLALFIQVITPVKKPSFVLLTLALPLIYLIAELTYQPSISEHKPLPTSLSYLYDVDTQQGYFYNFDEVKTDWNKNLFTNRLSAGEKQQFRSDYFKPVKNLAINEPPVALKPVIIEAKRPLKQGEHQTIEIMISAHHNSRVLELFTEDKLTVYKLSIEGRNALIDKELHFKAGQRLMHYYFDGDKQIKIILEIGIDEQINWQVQTHSLDLFNRSDFTLEKRPIHLIPKAFIKSDNATSVQSFSFGFD